MESPRSPPPVGQPPLAFALRKKRKSFTRGRASKSAMLADPSVLSGSNLEYHQLKHFATNTKKKPWKVATSETHSSDLLQQYGLFSDSLPGYQWWMSFMMVLVIYTSIEAPFQLAFGTEEEWALEFIGWFEKPITACFALDMFINFNTAVRQQEYYIVDRWLIFRIYSRGWLVVDFVSWVPWDWVIVTFFAVLEALDPTAVGNATDSNLGGVSYQSLARAFRVVRLLRLLRLARLLKLGDYMIAVEERLKVNMHVLFIFRTVVLLMYFTHVLACIWFAVGVEATRLGYHRTWLSSSELADSSPEGETSYYLEAAFWALNTLLLNPEDIHNRPELIVAIVSLAFGAFIFSYIFSMVNDALKSVNVQAVRVNEKLAGVREFCRKYNLSRDVSTRIRSFYEAFYSKHAVIAEETEILRNLTSELRREIEIQLLHNSVTRCSVFFVAGEAISSPRARMDFYLGLLRIFTPVVFGPQDLVLPAYVANEELLFLGRGAVGAYIHLANSGNGDNRGRQDERGSANGTSGSVRSRCGCCPRRGAEYEDAEYEDFADGTLEKEPADLVLQVFEIAEIGSHFGQRAVLSHQAFKITRMVEYKAQSTGCELWAVNRYHLFAVLADVPPEAAETVTRLCSFEIVTDALLREKQLLLSLVQRKNYLKKMVKDVNAWPPPLGTKWKRVDRVQPMTVRKRSNRADYEIKNFKLREALRSHRLEFTKDELDMMGKEARDPFTVELGSFVTVDGKHFVPVPPCGGAVDEQIATDRETCAKLILLIAALERIIAAGSVSAKLEKLCKHNSETLDSSWNSQLMELTPFLFGEEEVAEMEVTRQKEQTQHNMNEALHKMRLASNAFGAKKMRLVGHALGAANHLRQQTLMRAQGTALAPAAATHQEVKASDARPAVVPTLMSMPTTIQGLKSAATITREATRQASRLVNQSISKHVTVKDHADNEAKWDVRLQSLEDQMGSLLSQMGSFSTQMERMTKQLDAMSASIDKGIGACGGASPGAAPSLKGFSFEGAAGALEAVGTTTQEIGRTVSKGVEMAGMTVAQGVEEASSMASSSLSCAAQTFSLTGCGNTLSTISAPVQGASRQKYEKARAASVARRNTGTLEAPHPSDTRR